MTIFEQLRPEQRDHALATMRRNLHDARLKAIVLGDAHVKRSAGVTLAAVLDCHKTVKLLTETIRRFEARRFEARK